MYSLSLTYKRSFNTSQTPHLTLISTYKFMMKTLILFISAIGAVVSQRHHHYQPPINGPDHQNPNQHYPNSHNQNTLVGRNGDGCPSWQTYPSQTAVNGNKCYEFILQKPEDWATALRDCRLKGGHLLTLESSAEETFVMKNLLIYGYHGKGVWIGLHDINKEGNFEWESGKPLTFSHWDKGQPDDYHYRQNQDCVLLYVPQRNDFQDYQDGTPGWHDQVCKDFLFDREDDGWICEYDRNTTLVHVSTPVVTSIPQTTVRTTPKPMTMAPTAAPTTQKVTTMKTTAQPTESTQQETTAVNQGTNPHTTTAAQFIIGK